MPFSPDGSPALVSVRGVSKHFGAFHALSNIHLDIRQGELLTFLGPSGCGKSTLLRIITGLERQTAGAIHHEGRDISRLSTAQRGFGILFQSYALFPNLTVAQNVAYGLKLPRAAAAQRVAELLALVDLAGTERKYPSALSGGQQQRVALARALAPSPKLLLLDEPLSALDAKVRVRLRQQIRDLQQKLGLTTVMVTHDQEEALAMADRIVVMNHGTVEQIGTPSQIYGAPASLFVADFVGQMNFLTGRSHAPGGFTPDGASRPLFLGCEMPAGPLTACIRPEDVIVGPPAVAPAPDHVAGQVDAIEFLGAFCRMRLAVPALGGASLAADVSAQVARDLALAVGAPVSVTLPAHRLQVFTGARHA